MIQDKDSIQPADNVDPLKARYRQSVAEHPGHQRNLAERDTALLTIDMQYLDAARGHGVFASVESSGVSAEAQEYYFQELENKVIPNIRRLQDCFRANELEVIHTRIQCLTKDGRDRSAGHKRLGLLASPGSIEAEFVPEVAPVGDEIVVNKTSSGVFSSTNMSYVLRNLGINALFVAGVYTNECVDTTIRAACDIGYFVTLIEDACTTVTPTLHEATIATLRDRYARILNTEQAINEINQVVSV